MFAPSQNHKTVSYNPTSVKATGVISIKELQSLYTKLQTSFTYQVTENEWILIDEIHKANKTSNQK